MTTAVEVKEKPILFSAPMVRDLLEGRKTQTRRIVSCGNSTVDGSVWSKERFASLNFNAPDLNEDTSYRKSCGCLKYLPSSMDYDPTCGHRVRSRWMVGDRLWVREAWRTGSELNEWNASEIAAKCLDAGYKSPGAPTFYIADSATRAWGEMAKEDFGDWGRYRHPRFMPRWASRIKVEITEVRVQRLQEISEADAKAEGAEWYGFADLKPNGDLRDGESIAYRAGFHDLWQSINGEESWQASPWVWPVTFKAVV